MRPEVNYDVSYGLQFGGKVNIDNIPINFGFNIGSKSFKTGNNNQSFDIRAFDIGFGFETVKTEPKLIYDKFTKSNIMGSEYFEFKKVFINFHLGGSTSYLEVSHIINSINSKSPIKATYKKQYPFNNLEISYDFKFIIGGSINSDLSK